LRTGSIARLRFVNCLDVDRRVRSENLVLCTIGCDAYHAAIVIIVRRLEKGDLEASYCRHRAYIVLTSNAAGRKVGVELVDDA
jgi:hypothetical protein